MGERYNPLAEGHVEPAGKDAKGRQTWTLTVEGLRQQAMVEDELRNLGYVQNEAGLWVHDPQAREELGLEALAMEEYERLLGKTVRVNQLLGYTNRDFSEEKSGDFVVRIDATPRSDVLRWVDDWLDPVYNVTVLEANGLPGRSPLRSCWIYGKSYHRGVAHETQPGSIAEEICQHEPDIDTLALPHDLHPETHDGRIEFVIDVVCSKCGTSGSFAVTVSPEDINW
jgi:hypothetical protein